MTQPAIYGHGTAYMPSAGGGGIAHGALVTNYSGTATVYTLTTSGRSHDVPVQDVKIDTDGYWQPSGPDGAYIYIKITGLYLLSAGSQLQVVSTHPTTGSCNFVLTSTELGDLGGDFAPWDIFSPSGVDQWEASVSVTAWLTAGVHNYIEWYATNWTDQSLEINGTSTQFISATLLHE